MGRDSGPLCPPARTPFTAQNRSEDNNDVGVKTTTAIPWRVFDSIAAESHFAVSINKMHYLLFNLWDKTCTVEHRYNEDAYNKNTAVAIKIPKWFIYRVFIIQTLGPQWKIANMSAELVPRSLNNGYIWKGD